ncbi:non-ribosomal peptide synthetase [Methylobacterium sp. JK268]
MDEVGTRSPHPSEDGIVAMAEAGGPQARPAGLPLTVAQKRIWSLGQIGDRTLFPPQVLVLRLPDRGIDALLRSVAARQPSLRSRFRRFPGGRIEQVATAPDALAVETLPLSPAPGEAAEAALERAVAAFAGRPFDLDHDPASRFARVALPDGEAALVVVLHPIVADPASLRVLAAEILAETRREGARAPVADPGDLVRAEQAFLASPAFAEALAHWREALAEEPAATALPAKPTLAGAAEGGRARRPFRIAPETVAALRGLAREAGVPLATLLLTGLATLLARYGGHWTARLGTVIENRDAPGRAALIGRIEDILPLVCRLGPDLGFLDAARQVQRGLDEGVARHVPFERLAQALWRHDGDATDGLVRTVFALREPVLGAQDPRRATLVSHAPGGRADADLLVTAIPAPDGSLEGVMDFAEGVHAASLVSRAADHLGRILAAAAANGAVRLGRIALVEAAELDRLSAPYPDDALDDDRPVHDLIADHGRTTPDRIAIIWGEERWSHGRLDAHANRIAHCLRGAGIGPEDCVAIAIRRSPEAIAAMLGTLKAGGAYVPIEPDHPPARNHHILRDAGVKVVLTHAALREKIPADIAATVIALDRTALAALPATPPATPPVHPDQLAYVMYTSGSTGKPKGVAVEHGPLTHHLQATARVYGMSAESRELPFLPFSSDGGHERWMNPLMVGGSIVLPDQPLWTPDETLSAMRRHGANNASIPTTYLQQLAEWAQATDGAPPMRLYSFGGEGLPQATFDLLSRALKAEWLINGYGPTETIMTPMVWKVPAGTRFEGAYAPLGRCVGRRRAYILDPDLNPCPIGVTGELYLGGEGVARGYVGRPGVTADRFVPDPFAPQGGRLYRSGDLARWREDGSVDFVGRVDLQVKLRGFRIELGEIEAALRAQEGVGEGLVILREDDGRKALVAYAVPKAGAALDPEALRRALARLLPDYMVPAAVVPLARMPTNPSSKLDRAALPAPPAARAAAGEPPATPLETELVALWRDVLGVPALGVTDDFFEAGGNSLSAVRIVARLRESRPKARVTIADLFNAPTVRRLAASIARGGEALGGQVIRLRETGARPMLYCFPGLLVSTREYVKLVDFLGPDQPATGFICYSLSEEKKLDASVAEITGRYVEHIRRESAGRPCAFLGWSWGGLLAYEAARMLGTEVDLRLVGMVDVCDLGTEFAIGAVPHFAPGEREALHRRVTAWLGRTRMRADWDRLLGSMDARTYDQFLRFVGDEEDGLPEDGPDIASREHTFWILIDNALIFRRYEPRPYDCPIHAWAAEDSLHRGLNLMDWRRLSRRANPAEIIAGTNHLHVIGSSAFHSRFAHRLEEAIRGTSPTLPGRDRPPG